MDIVIFTDGSCNNNLPMDQRCGGYGVFFQDSNINGIHIAKKLKGKYISSQVAELTSIVKGIERCLSKFVINKIIIYSDSMYSINCITKWSEKWIRNNWRKSNGEKIENKKLIKKLYFYNKNINLEFHHVKSHTKKPKEGTEEYKLWFGNFTADVLAKNGVKNGTKNKVKKKVKNEVL